MGLEQMFTLLSSDISVVTCKWIIEYIARPNDLKKTQDGKQGIWSVPWPIGAMTLRVQRAYYIVQRTRAWLGPGLGRVLYNARCKRWHGTYRPR